MNYYICEGEILDSAKYNAGSKARNDVEIILDKENYSKFFIPTKRGVQEKKILKIIQLFQYIKNKYIWDKNLKKTKKGDNVIIQYPLNNTTIGFSKVIKKYCKKGINFIAIIHDLDSLRKDAPNMTKSLSKRVVYEDKTILKEFSKIISHNKVMTDELIKLGCKKENIVELEIFDYLIDNNLTLKERKLNLPIVIAGNLSPQKSGYIGKIGDIAEINFNLYGKGIEKDIANNAKYMGSFLPDELPSNLEGSFGLVWDGPDIYSCNGAYGNYLKYNNPHKASLYMISNLPIIAWSKSAMAEFIQKNNIGILVNDLKEIPEKLKELSNEDYKKILENVQIISQKVTNGYYLTTALKNIGI